MLIVFGILLAICGGLSAAQNKVENATGSKLLGILVVIGLILIIAGIGELME